MRTAIVTGACGFIGRNFVSELLRAGYYIFAIDCVDNSLFHDTNNLTYIKSDLSDIDGCINVIKRKCDIIYHLAWNGVNAESRSDIQIQKKNIDICINVVDIAKQLCISEVVFVGSTMEYCYTNDLISEKSIPTPANCYGSIKVATRFLCSQLCKDSGIDFKYVVFTSIYGTGREDGNVIYYCIKNLLNNEPVKLSQCVQKWDFIHISDAVNALRLVGEKGTSNSFYAVGAGENKQLKEYIEIILKIVNSSAIVEYGAIKYKNNLIPNSAVDIKKLTDDTGFKPSYHFSDGIIDVINFYRSSE